MGEKKKRMYLKKRKKRERVEEGGSVPMFLMVGPIN